MAWRILLCCMVAVCPRSEALFRGCLVPPSCMAPAQPCLRGKKQAEARGTRDTYRTTCQPLRSVWRLVKECRA